MKMEDIKIGMEVVVTRKALEVFFEEDKLGINIVKEANQNLLFFEGHNYGCLLSHIRKVTKLEKAMK